MERFLWRGIKYFMFGIFSTVHSCHFNQFEYQNVHSVASCQNSILKYLAIVVATPNFIWISIIYFQSLVVCNKQFYNVIVMYF